MQMDMSLNQIIKCRAPIEIKARILRLGNKRMKSESEVSREAILAFVESEEKRLELPPITPREVRELLGKPAVKKAA